MFPMVCHPVSPNYYKTRLICKGQHRGNQFCLANCTRLCYCSKRLLPFPVRGLSFPLLVMADVIKSLANDMWLGGMVTLLSTRFGTITRFCYVVFSICLHTETSQAVGHSFSLASGRLRAQNTAAADGHITRRRNNPLS